MVRNRAIFLAFAGGDVRQAESILDLGEAYQCWNLGKFDLELFIANLKERIPPVNDNVLSNYEAKEESAGSGITEKLFGECSWGLLIPDCLDDAIAMSYGETLFLVNLFSPVFLYPVFYAGDNGITRVGRPRIPIPYQNQSSVFARSEFVKFFQIMLRHSQHGALSMDRAQRWNKEDWRLFVAGMLFNGLRDYDGGKSAIGWQRESADMAAVLECLFTADDSRNEEVGYRLRKRIAVLLAHRVQSIEDDVKKLYDLRSSFVHGRFYSEIAKEIAKAPDKLPTPDFELLDKHKNHVRLAIVAYLHLAGHIRSRPEMFSGAESVMTALENAIIDTELRNKLLERVEEVLQLLSPNESARET